MKRKILISMLAVFVAICMLTACGNSSNTAQDEEKQTAEESDGNGTELSGDGQEAAGGDAEGTSRNVVYRSDEFYLSIDLPEIGRAHV